MVYLISHAIQMILLTVASSFKIREFSLTQLPISIQYDCSPNQNFILFFFQLNTK